MMRILSSLYLICLILSHVSFCKTFYVSNEGHDANNGLYRSAPLFSLSRLSNVTLKPGDSVLFRRGDVFFGSLIISSSGEKNNDIYIGAYGSTGAYPILSGAISKTVREDGNYYKCKVDSNIVKQVFLNDQLLTLARSPNDGFYRIEKDHNEFLYDDLSLDSINPIKAKLKALTRNWQWEIRKVIDYDGQKITLDSLVWRSFRKGYGYYLEGKPEFLDQKNEWYFSEDTGELSMLLDADKPQTVLLTLLDNGITLDKGIKHITIDGLLISKFAESAIYLCGGNSNIVIKNCEITNSEVFGILGEYDCQRISILSNHINDIRGKGIEFIEPKRLSIKENTITKIGLIQGYGFDGVNNGTGIAITNREFRTETDTTYASNNLIEANRIDSTGYNGIRMDGVNSTCTGNYISNAVLNMNDGAGIYCWALPHNTDYTTGNVISNNIIRNVVSSNEASAGTHRIAAGIYLDNFSNSISVKGNKIMDCQKGILINDASFKIKVHNNVLYNNEKGIVIDIYKRDTIRRGEHEILENEFHFKDPHHTAISIQHRAIHQFDLGSVDKNIYNNPLDHYLNEVVRVSEDEKSTIHYTHSGWISETGYDRDATIHVPTKEQRTWELKDRSQILVNSDPHKSITKMGSWVDITGMPVLEVQIEPLSVRVVYKKE